MRGTNDLVVLDVVRWCLLFLRFFAAAFCLAAPLAWAITLETATACSSASASSSSHCRSLELLDEDEDDEVDENEGNTGDNKDGSLLSSSPTAVH